jgi:hypothetical protein
MSNHLDKALSNQEFREKVGFTSGVGKALAGAAAKEPFWTFAGLGTAGGAAAILGNKALGVTGQPMDTESYLLNKQLNSGLKGVLNRVQADEMLATSMTKNVGEIANSFVNEAVSDMGKSYKQMIYRPEQQAVLKDLMASDEMLRDADPGHVASLFNTMVDVAPKMTKYKDAVKSFLRQGIAHEGGLDPVTIGELAKAEARLGGKGLDAS